MVIKKDSLKIQKLKASARKVSIKEGIFATVRSSFGDHYISPFAIAINSSNSMIAMFGAVSGILGPLTQLSSSRLMENYSRKKIVIKSVFIEALMWLPLIITAFLFYKGIIINILPLMLLFFFSIYTIIVNIHIPAWFSWMGDIIDDKHRGRWFSKRHLIIGIVTAVLTISSAFFLDIFKKNNLAMVGFMIFFFVAFLGRIASARTFKKQYEPQIKLKKGYYFSFTEFLLKAPKNNFGKFTIFRAMLAFASSISGPLIAVYLLRNLGFNYLIYTIIIFFGTGAAVLILQLWGKFADKYGNYRVFCITTIFIPLIPLLWILNSSIIYLILVPSLIGGIAWAGFNLSAGNFIYDNVSVQKRGLAISYYNMLVGIGVFLGASLGAVLIKYINFGFIEPLFAVFIIGTILRMVVVFIFLPKIKEIRKTKKFNLTRTIKHIRLKDIESSVSEEVHDIVSIKDYLRE